MKQKEIESPLKRAIVQAKENGDTDREVAKQYSVGKTTVSRIYRRFKDIGSIAKIHRSGRPRKTTKRQEALLTRIVKKNPFKTAVDVAKEAFERLSLEISSKTAGRILRRAP